MKDVLKKAIAIFVIMMMFINSSFLVVISSAIEAIDKIIDESKIHPLYEINLEKYMNYSLESDRGTLVQFNLKTGIEYIDGEEYKPLSSTEILLNLPKIEEEYPENVEILGKSSKATNGNDAAKDFEFEYDTKSGKLKIKTLNKENEDGSRYQENVENARDEYTVICYYSSNCYNNENIERTLEVTGELKEAIIAKNNLEKSIEINKSFNVADNISGLVSTNIITSDIYNGYINSNKQNGTNYKTEYVENLEVNISKKEISNEITVNTENSFIDNKDNIEKTSDIIYKLTRVNKKDILDILGEDGYLQILDENNELLGEINKDTEVGDNNIYEITYKKEISRIKIKTSKPLKVGTIFLQSIKDIRETVTNDEINRIQVDSNIECINKVEVTEEKTQKTENDETKNEEIKEKPEIIVEARKVYDYSDTQIIQLQESKTNIDLTMNRTEWTNNIQNEVEFNVKLIANDIKHRLFENPVIEIRLPSEVEKVILGEASLLYARDDIQIENVEIVEDNGSKIIRAKLAGKQSDYYNKEAMIQGTELLIPVTIILKKDIYDIEGILELNVTNNNTYEQKENKQYKVNIVSIKLQTVDNVKLEENVGSSSVENTAEGIVTEVKAILGEKPLENGQTVYEHEYIRYNIKIKNESNFRKENINVVGKVPEGATFVNCYFGEYSFETEDFYHIEEDTEKKEYNENISLDANEERELEYWIRVNLLAEEENQKDLESEVNIFVGEQNINEYRISNIVKEAKLELKITASELDNQGNRWIYHFAVKNNTQNLIKNVVADIKLPNEAKFVSARHHLNDEYGYSVEETTSGLRINFPEIVANEEKVAWIEIQVSRIEESQINFEIQTYGTVKGDGTDIYNSNLNKEKIHTFDIQVVQNSEKEGQELQYDENVEFNVKIKNISDEKIHLDTQSLKIMNYADTNLVPISAEYEYEKINNETGERERCTGTTDISYKHVPEGVEPTTVPDLNIPLGILKNGEIKLTLKYKAGEVKERTETSNCIKVQYENGGTYVKTSNIIKNIILPKEETPDIPDIPEEQKKYSISGLAWEDENKNGQYDDNENKLSNITVKLIDANTNTTIVDDEGNSVIARTNNNGEYIFNKLKAGRYILVFEYDKEEYSLTSYKVVSVSEDRNSNAIAQKIVIDGVSVEVDSTEIIVIEEENINKINIGLIKKQDIDKPIIPEEPKTYSISGFAWEDKNKNGQYEENENKLSNIKVKLVNAETNKTVLDNNGNIVNAITDLNGNYIFENIKIGKYILVFEYDNDNYGLTVSKKDEVEENKNSKVIEKQLTIDDKEDKYAVTDILNLDNNVRYINIGLINKNENPENPDNPEGQKNYSISGFAWEDKNKDGRYDNNETKLSNITVKLFNAETNSIVKDKDGKNLEIKTDDNGNYKFEKVKPGKYLVLFEYDSNNYILTAYKKEMVSEDKNSNVIKKQVAIDGVEKTVGLTDILTVDNNDIFYINIGLIKNHKFDLSLHKSITKLRVTYDGFNKEYNYNESKLVKVEIPAKKISGAKIEVQYQIKITNEGEMDGYVDEIVDYLPEGFTFDSSKNSGWTQNGNSMLKNTTYAGVIIKPGETKVVTLYLTRTLTNETIGTLRNSAEILKSSSINGDKDIDSTNGNRVETEDDYSVAELIISIKTGAMTYIGISMLIGLAVIIVLKILSNKRIINFKKLGIFIIVFSVLGIIFTPKQNSTYTTDRDVNPSYGEMEDLVKNYVDNHHDGPISCNYSTKAVKEGEDPGSYDWQNGEEYRTEKYKEVISVNEPTKVTELVVDHFNNAGMHLGTGSKRCTDDDNYAGCVREEVEEKVSWKDNWVSKEVEKERQVKYLHYHTANGYIHHGKPHGRGQWYCVAGGNMAQDPNVWNYSYGSVTNINISSVTLGDISGAVTVSNNSNASYLPYDNGQEDNNYFVVGPFNFSTNGSITGVYPSAGQLCDRAGNPILGITNGMDFYILVTKDILNVSVTVNVQNTASRKYYVNATWTEQRVYPGGQELDKDDGADNIEGEFSIQTYDSATASVGIPTTNLILDKKDYDTLSNLNGFRVEVKESYYHYKKTFYIQGASITIPNLPCTENTTYIVTELSSPDGYDYSKQIEYDLDIFGATGPQLKALYGRLSLVNRQFIDIGIEKKVFGFDVKMDGIGFKIYAVTKDGSGWLRTGSCSYGGIIGQIDANAFLTADENAGQIFYTDSNGRIDLRDLPMGTYTFKEVYMPDKYAPWYNMSRNIQYNTFNASVTSTKRIGNIIIEDTIKRGHLYLMKTDYDTKQKLSGAEFNITNNLNPSDVRYVNMNVKIPASGILRFDNLPIGEYTITETKAPNSYNIGLQISTQKVTVQEDPVAVQIQHQTVKVYEVNSISGGIGVVTFDYKNRIYGDLKVQKIDTDTGLSNLEDLILKDIKFVISYRLPNETTRRYMQRLEHYSSGDVQYEIIPTASGNINGAQVFTTNANSIFEINNLPQYYIYYIEEVEIPKETEQYYDIRQVYEAKLNNNYDGTNNRVVTIHKVDNKQKRVDLEGYVWEDIASGKTTTRDELYKEGTADKRVPGLTVYLKKNGNIIAERKTDGNGRYFFEARGYRNKVGLASKNDCDYTIDIDTITQYVVEFEYNGLKYEKVLTNLVVDNGSKATEIDTNRKAFNEKFYNIQKDKTGTNVGLTYTRPKSGVSELVQNTAYTVQSLNNSVNPNSEALMLADTKTAGYEIKWAAGVRTIKNINLGIFERAQPDLSIATDIDDIQLTINGSYSHTYEYKTRSPYMNNTGIPDKDVNPGYDAVLDGFSVGVKRGNGTYKDCSYTREIYDSYIAYTKENSDSTDRLRVFVKYRIAIKNESASLISRASLKNYADNRLNYSNSYYLGENGKQVPVSWNSVSNGVWQSEEVEVDINPAECVYVYLIYELNTNTVIEMANLKYDETLKMDDNITEISTYSTWDKNGNKYGGIDKDSAPDNIQIGNFDTYEDDTDVAPGLSFARKASKIISGLVYEDQVNQGSELKTGVERIGNGKYDSGERTISNVDVQIIDCDKNSTIKLYNLDSSGNVVLTEAKYITKENGEYTFTGLVPGKYRIQYTYGRYNDSTQSKINNNIEITTESYKSTIVNANKFRTLIDNGYIDYNSSDLNALWYWYQKPENFEYSSAVDEYGRRSDINKNLSIINYKVKDDYDNLIDDPENHYMVANTGVMDFPIEDTRVQTTAIDYIEGSREYKLKFGIAERPRQSLELNKEISHIRIILANGQVFAEGDPRNNDTMKYIQYPMYGKLKIEIDNEIIEGATIDLEYEITVDNKSELDYDHIRYYRYGDKDNEVLSKIVKINLDAIADYVDEKLSVTHNIEDTNSDIEYYNFGTDTVNNKWKLITELTAETNRLAGIDIKEDVYNLLKSTKRTNIVVVKSNKKIEPYQTERFYLKTKKLLTSLSGDDMFDNFAELIQSSNPVGRFYGVMTSKTKWEFHTPGNFSIGNIENTSESDNSSYHKGYQAQATIIPPTGTKQIIIYYSIGFVSLVILAGGIILIKKKVIT